MNALPWNELVGAHADRQNISKAQAERDLRAVFGTVQELIHSNQGVKIPEVGILEPTTRSYPARMICGRPVSARTVTRVVLRRPYSVVDE